MKITIDTKEDSHEDIRKVISMLSHLVEGHEVPKSTSTNIFEDGTPVLGASEPEESSEPSPEPPKPNAFASMFGDSAPSTSTPTSSSEDDEAETEEESDDPQIEIVDY